MMRLLKLSLAALTSLTVSFTSATATATLIEGRLVHARDGSPVVGAQVTTSPPGHVACTDAQGRYRLRLDGITNERYVYRIDVPLQPQARSVETIEPSKKKGGRDEPTKARKKERFRRSKSSLKKRRSSGL